MVELTEHARRRCSQRGIRPAAIVAALAWGREFRPTAGRVVYFVGRRDVERAAENGTDLRPYEGLAVVVGGERVIITVIWTPRTSRFRRRLVRVRSRRSAPAARRWEGAHVE